ncbi:MAG TPA: right-handed parallel beta-helix repeat-containing protein [Gaiellales bacterium]|nr:right-handed parallel beta-helix repeat-containing protein [Gaiellales bacterium]
MFSEAGVWSVRSDQGDGTMDRRAVRRLAGVGLITAFVAGASSSFAATETTVDCGAGADLQAAINAAPKGAILDISGRCVGSFTVGRNLTLKGVSNAVLDGGGSRTVTSGTTLTITAGKVRLSKLLVTGGFPDSGVGGVLNAGSLTLTHVTVSGNEGDFGGIVNHGTLTVLRSVVTKNLGGVGGIWNLGTATVGHTTISSNGENGIVNGEWFSGSPAGTLTVTDSTVNNNGATFGGGIDNESGSAAVVRSTIANNFADNGAGGGIANRRGNRLTVVASTISGNTTDEGGGGIWTDGPTTVTGTIIAGNTDSNDGSAQDCTGVPTSGGYNLFGTPCGTAQATDQVGTADAPLNALLKALGSYGGPTQTMVPRTTSPAVNKVPIGATSSDGTIALCPSSGTTDQRGIPRPQSGACDIGSVERKPRE